MGIQSMSKQYHATQCEKLGCEELSSSIFKTVLESGASYKQFEESVMHVNSIFSEKTYELQKSILSKPLSDIV